MEAGAIVLNLKQYISIGNNDSTFQIEEYATYKCSDKEYETNKNLPQIVKRFQWCRFVGLQENQLERE